MLLAEAGGLFEGVRHLQDAEVCLVAADDLHSHRKSLGREAAWHRSCRITRGRYIPAGFHPFDVALKLHPRDLRWIRSVDIECRQLGGGQNEVFILFEECLEAPPHLGVGGLGARQIGAAQPLPFLNLALQSVLESVWMFLQLRAVSTR